MSEPTLDELLATARDLAHAISLDVEEVDNNEVIFDRKQFENELTEALVAFAHKCLHARAKADLDAAPAVKDGPSSCAWSDQFDTEGR